MPQHLIGQLWTWIAGPGINLAIIIAIALLIPRAGRFADRLINREVAVNQDEDESKSTLAFWGVGIYVVQIIAYFILILAFLKQLGFSLAGAAIPATVVSAAVGFGAQSIIADFLAGFFLLSEKQYGVGDWVRFEGNGIEVEGTVIAITMRATKIRTLAQETVIIPNSTARISVNASNYWSRAVIVMPIPLLGSANPTEAASRAERACRRALTRPDVSPELIGELDVQPAVDINPPATVGSPWTMDMRFMIQVTAGNHWFVERCVRMALLEEFWSEYGSATTATGELVSHIEHQTEEEPQTELMAPVSPSDSQAGHGASSPVPEQFKDDHGGDPAASDGRGEDDDADSDQGDEQELTSTWQRIRAEITAMRSSTMWLLGVLIVLLILKPFFFSTETEEGERIAGWLAPPASTSSRPQPTETSTFPETEHSSSPVTTETTEPTEVETTPEPTTRSTPTPQRPTEQRHSTTATTTAEASTTPVETKGAGEPTDTNSD